MPKTLYDKLFDSHVVRDASDGSVLLYIDRHLLNEVTSPQAFDRLGEHQRMIWRPRANLAVADHNVPTSTATTAIADPIARKQVGALASNCDAHGITHFGMHHPQQGIVHVTAPEMGYTLPGMTIVCGDSHTSTHGAFGALAFGIGTSEIEHVLATQTLMTRKSKGMRIYVSGELQPGCSSKDLALAIIGQIGTSGASGFAIEFAGPAIERLSMEARMTLCNMAIEAGARTGLVAVDDVTINYCRGRPFSPSGEAWDAAEREWRTFFSEDGAEFDTSVEVNASSIGPQVTWGTSPDMVVSVTGRVPAPEGESHSSKRAAITRALRYMGLVPHTSISDIPVDKVFIGSCTNARIEDLREAARIVTLLEMRVAPSIKSVLVVLGSYAVKKQAESEGLDKIFQDAGFEWRNPGCSMCLGMNDDHLNEGERVASTSNRNFEGRQGAGGR